MVKIFPLKPFLPKDPEEFCTNPYDIIGKEEEQQLKKIPHSLIHLILPDGESDQKYQNAAKVYKQFQDNQIITKETLPSVFIYRQESDQFNQQGLIVGLALKDYEEGNIVKHESTRKKPLHDRINHIISSHVSAGLVLTIFKANKEINYLVEQIKKKKPKFDFKKYNYRHLLWQETSPAIIQQLTELFKKEKVFIADGHHRAASAAEYRKRNLKESNISKESDVPWQYLLSYIASDDQIRILSNSRVIRRLSIDDKEFLKKLEINFKVYPMKKAFNPEKKNQIALCLKGKWYKLINKEKKFNLMRDSLDVVIIQDKILTPILGIIDPRADENLFFLGGIQDPNEMENYITEKGNDLLINLFPVDIHDLEEVATANGVMPPKSTWFDPKLLSGLVLHDLTEKQKD
jgi:uncharacterized protein (DUF1015 family)